MKVLVTAASVTCESGRRSECRFMAVCARHLAVLLGLAGFVIMPVQPTCCSVYWLAKHLAWCLLVCPLSQVD